MTLPAPAAALAPFLELRAALEEAGWDTGADRRLSEALTAAVVALAEPVPPGAVVLAVGGFGRGSLALRSDVDLLILHRGAPDEGFVRRLLRPLWDAGLKVGQSVRTPKDARSFAATRLDTLCLFLTGRVVAGDRELAGDFELRLRQLVVKDRRRILDELGAEELARRATEPRRLMGMDVKRGRGGMRCLDLLDWRRRLDEAAGVQPGPVTHAEIAARATLMSVRSALHAVTRRPHETWDFELREPASRWLHATVPEVGRGLLVARRSGERLVGELWPVLRRTGPAELPRTADDPVLRSAVRSIARGEPAPAQPLETGEPRWTPGDRRVFLALTDPRMDPFLTRLLDSGWVDRALPEWGALRDVPHLVPFHRYTVLDHTLATVAEMQRLLAGDPSTPLAAEIVPSIEDDEAPLWSALFHDLGKAQAGEHTRAGVPLARRATQRLGLAPRVADLVVGVVENHLLLADLATRADVEDQVVTAAAADRIGGLEALRLLYLVTVADSRATGSDTWSDWRAELVRRAYRRLERALLLRSLPDSSRTLVLTEQVLAAGGAVLGRNEVESHLAGLTDVYRSSHTPDVIAEHVLLSRLPLGPGGVRLSATMGDATLRVIVVARDRPGLLTTLSGVLALERLSIIDARFATRSDGRVFDTFEVVDGLSGRRPESGRLESVERYVQRALRGGFALEAALQEKQRAYRQTQRLGVEPVVRITRTEQGKGTVDVEAADRLGLLHDVGTVFARFAMPVSRARVDTRGGVAYDTFHVERLPADVAGLEGALLEVL